MKARDAFPIGLLWLGLLWASHAGAYVLKDLRWEDPTVTFWVSLPGAEGLWNQNFEYAMGDWLEATGFDFGIMRDSYVDPCTETSGRNGVKWASESCSGAFGEAIAVEHTWGSGGWIVRSGIVFNSAMDWDVYPGPPSPDGVIDFARVALHELGHTIGLGHEDRVDTVMRTAWNDMAIYPTGDDIAGVHDLYPELVPEPSLALLQPASLAVLLGLARLRARRRSRGV